MKNYKDYSKKFIGDSDSAFLTASGNGESVKLNFGEDGAYYAYIVDDEAQIGSHYTKTAEFSGPVEISDDHGISFTAEAERIEIFRAGSFGCIIRLMK